MTKTRKGSKTKNRSTRKITCRAKNHKIRIGVLTVPLSPDSKFFKVCGSSYVYSGHEDWLKSEGIEIINIPYYHNNLKKFIPLVDGLYLPSGGAFASTQNTYYYASKELLKLAIKENERRCFPVWGGCMGMQQMMIVADGNDNYNDFLETFDSYKNYKTPLFFTEEGMHSQLFSLFSKKELDKMQTTDCSLHNHTMGLTPDTFKKCEPLNSFYRILQTSFDRNNKEFVSTIEARNYPFYGVQWHPERQPQFKKMLKAFKNKLQRDCDKKLNRKHKALKSRKYQCRNYSNDLYNKCTFFWEHDNPIVDEKKCVYLSKYGYNSNGKRFAPVG